MQSILDDLTQGEKATIGKSVFCEQRSTQSILGDLTQREATIGKSVFCEQRSMQSFLGDLTQGEATIGKSLFCEQSSMQSILGDLTHGEKGTLYVSQMSWKHRSRL